MTDLKMQNFKNILEGIRKNDEVFYYIKEKISEEFSVKLFKNLISLPAIKDSYEEKFKLVLNVLKCGLENDEVISELCEMLITIQPYLWKKYKKELLKEIIELNFFNYNRKNQLKLFDTMETMYAKGYSGSLKIIQFILDYIRIDDSEIFSYNEETLRLKLAKKAYFANECNGDEKLEEINDIKNYLKKSEHYHYLGMLYYYKAICVSKMLQIYQKHSPGFYMDKAKERKFKLAMQFKYCKNNFETSGIL